MHEGCVDILSTNTEDPSSTSTYSCEKQDKSTNTKDPSSTSTYSCEKQDKGTNTIDRPVLPPEWCYGNPMVNEEIRLFQVAHVNCTDEGKEPFRIKKSLVVLADGTWFAYVEGVHLQCTCAAFSDIPLVLTPNDSLVELFTRLHTSYICIGNRESKFVEMCEAKKGKLLSIKKAVVAFLHETDCKVVRHVSSELLVQKESQRCSICQNYRKQLSAMYFSYAKTSLSKTNTNLRYLRTPHRTTRIANLQMKVKRVLSKNRRLTKTLNDVNSTSGITTDSQLEQDLLTAITTNKNNISKLPLNDFQRILWEQQGAALKVKSKNSIRWHPLFIRWALNIMIGSPKVYNIIRESGVIILPSKRTLKDYTHWFRSDVGFQNEMFEHLMEEYKVAEFNEPQRHVVLVFDEMRIQESLVFDKSGGNIVGYVDVGDMNMLLNNLETSLEKGKQEREVATHMLMLYVRGICSKIEYPLAQFPTTGVHGKQLHELVWTAVRRLLEIGLKVIVIICDGAGPNRTFFKLHKDEQYMKKGVVYKVQNMFDTSKFIWFMSDICHLLKTTRNCWESSSKNGTRHLQNNGKHILWRHIIDLYEKTRQDNGLYIGHKLKQEHVKLSAYSRINVRLAAQVLSKSVADCFCTIRQLNLNSTNSVYSDTTETEMFCRMFNHLFDCFNARNLLEATQKANNDLKPYSDIEDIRLKWLENTFLKYLDDWETYATSKMEIPLAERQKLTLSKQTKEGLKITILSFIEVVPYMLSLEGANFILSEKFNQDLLKAFFGKQRARCGRNDNPTVFQFTKNTQTIPVGRSMSFGGSSNIKLKLFHTEDVQDLSQPLRKKKRTIT